MSRREERAERGRVRFRLDSFHQLEEEKNRILHANGALQDTLAFAETKIVS